MQVILNGRLVGKQQASISLSDRGLLLADGLFETMRVYFGNILFFDFHWERLVNSLKKLFIPQPFSKEHLLEMILQLLNLRDCEKFNGSVRLTITRGESQRGIGFPEKINPTYFITLEPWVASKQNITLMVTTARRNEGSPIAQIKSLNYLENVLARHEANISGYDDALFLNSRGAVTESTVSNIFVVMDGKIYTPPLADGLMPGITRKVLLTYASRSGFSIVEKTMNLENISSSSEIFLTNALMGIQRVVLIENYFQAKEDKYFNLIASLYDSLIK